MVRLYKVARVRALAPFRLFVEFSDGASGEIDIGDFVGGGGIMVEPLRDPAFFARAFVDAGAVAWPNGLDLCPTSMRADMEADGAITSEAAE